jgi:hypothetical protein
MRCGCRLAAWRCWEHLSLHRKKSFWRVVLGCLVFSGLIFLAACGGSSSGRGGSGGQPGTPAGTYTITITATSESLTHAATVSLTVR